MRKKKRGTIGCVWVVDFIDSFRTIAKLELFLQFMLRQAERKYQESEKEAATLRNRVLILETTLSNQKLNDKTNRKSVPLVPSAFLFKIP